MVQEQREYTERSQEIHAHIGNGNWLRDKGKEWINEYFEDK